MEKLKLNQNQFAVGQADVLTGHLLNKDLTLNLNTENSNNIFEIFENLDEALEYAKKKIEENPNVEYWIINSKNETIFFESAFKNK